MNCTTRVQTNLDGGPGKGFGKTPRLSPRDNRAKERGD